MPAVSSSAINFIEYDPSTKMMKVTFQQGRTYDFCGVPEKVYEAFLNASSVGTYYNTHIRDRYQC